MDELFDIILELMIDGGIETSTNKKVPKYIRYPLIALIFIIFAVVIVGLFLLGLNLYPKDNLVGILFMGISLILLVGSIYKFNKTFKKNKSKE